jgi:hypothetical protein
MGMTAKARPIESGERPDDHLRHASGPRPHLATPPPRPEPTPSSAGGRRITWAGLGFTLAALALLFGYYFPTEDYLAPQSGIGYALGIAGGSAMLVLLLYPARKRIRVLSFMGSTRRWFQTHMLLGVVGPVLVLYHSNFSLGATNSNVALVCMLVVSGSGLFGRYFHAHIHNGLNGRHATLAELKAYAEKLRWVTTHVSFLPELVDHIEVEERRLTDRCARIPLLARPLVCAWHSTWARRRLRAHVRRSMPPAGATGTNAGRRRDLKRTAYGYIENRIAATRRVIELTAFERLFSLWHALHLPLFFMLLVAGIVHVIAVHVY